MITDAGEAALRERAAAANVEERDDDSDLHRIQAEVVIAGNHVDVQREAPACQHRQVNTETQAALIVDDGDVIVKREVMLRAVCGECGVAFRLDATTARPSRSHGELGVVVEIEVTAD